MRAARICFVTDNEENQLPEESDFCDPRSRDPDERTAVKHFLGKTAEQAEAMFRQSGDYYYEDLVWMRAPAFRFYVVPAIRHLLSEDANGQSDAVSSFCGVLWLRVKQEPSTFDPIASVVLNAIEKIIADFDRFQCSTDVYGDVPSRYRRVASRLIQGRSK